MLAIPAWLNDSEFGWRARIGVIFPSLGWTMEHEWIRLLPRGVSVHFTRVALRQLTLEQLKNMEEEIGYAADLLSTAKVNLLCFACTVGTMFRGIAYDRFLKQRLIESTDIPTVTMAEGAINALKKLNVQRIAIATPYADFINEHVAQFLEDNGFHVASMVGLQMTDSVAIARLSPRQTWELVISALKKANNPEGIFISCGNIRTIEVLDVLEKDTGLPVTSSNQALLWLALRELGIKESILGYGSLLEKEL